MMALLLLAAWTWNRPLTDCHGAPEVDLSHYWMRATVRILSSAGGNCEDEDGLIYLCPIELAGTPVPFVQIPDPGTGSTVTTTVDPVTDPTVLPTPPVGGLSAWPWLSVDNPQPILAVDMAGNKSDAVCP